MVMEGNGIVSNGWPLGLGNTNSRIRVAGAAPPPQPVTSRHHRSSSFSSFSSSNLNTESTTSFFRDGSVSLGRLIGIEANINSGTEGNNVSDESSSHRANVGARVPKQHAHNSYVDRFCAPLLHHVIGKINARSQTTSRH